jgi:hypothetical protein
MSDNEIMTLNIYHKIGWSCARGENFIQAISIRYRNKVKPTLIFNCLVYNVPILTWNRSWIEILDRTLSSIEPFLPDPKRNPVFCIACGNAATRVGHFAVEGAIIVEKYCDSCVKKGWIST